MSELATIEASRTTTTMGTGRNEARPRAMTMVIDGELGRDEMAEIGEMLLRLSFEGVTDLVIDFRGVTHLDYRTVPGLARRAQVFRNLGGDVKLAGLSEYLFTIFEAAGAHDDFDFFANVIDAQRAFRDAVTVQGA